MASFLGSIRLLRPYLLDVLRLRLAIQPSGRRCLSAFGLYTLSSSAAFCFSRPYGSRDFAASLRPLRPQLLGSPGFGRPNGLRAVALGSLRLQRPHFLETFGFG